MTIDYRTIHPDELPAFTRAEELAFGGVPGDDDVERAKLLFEPDRTFAAFEDGEIVGTNAAYTMPMSVPGGEVTVAFLTAVGVLPTHRRRGINTELMRRQLEDAHARRELVSVLIASEGGIYGRYGYGIGTFELSLEIANARTAFVRGVGSTGEVKLAPAEDAIPHAVDVVARTRRERPGMVALDERRFRYIAEHDHGPAKERPLFFALHHGPDGVDGFVAYKIEHDWRDSAPASTLEVRDLQALGPGAYADLWRYVFDVDLIERTVASERPLDEPLLHLLREPRRLRARVADGLWVRLVDVAGALEARRYAAAGRIVFEVEDVTGAWNHGRVALEVGADGQAHAGPTDADADIVCSVNELGATYLGGGSFRQLARAGRVREQTPRALDRADAMFGWDPPPWSPYDF